MHARRQAVRGALLVVAALALGGACGGRSRAGRARLADEAGPGAPGESPGSAAPGEIPPVAEPDRVRLVIDGEPQSLNPDLDPDAWTFRIAWDAIYEPLIRPRSDGEGFDPVLAERWTVEDDGRVLVFRLRPDVTFHDGRPFTAFDVAFTFDRLCSRRTHAPRVQASLADIDRIEVPNRATVRFLLRRPSAFLLSAIAEIGILSEHVFRDGDLNHHPANRRPVGTGPLRLTDWQRGRRITLVRNEAYWGEKAAAREIDIDVQVNAVEALGRARRGEADVVARVPAAWVPEQLDSPAVRARLQPMRVATSRFSFVVWNTQHAPLDDPMVRRAISLALDRQRLLEDARNGVGRPIAAVPANAAPAPPRSDLAQAQALLDRAGLSRAPGGYRVRGPGRAVRLTLLVPAGSHEAEVAAKHVGDTLDRLGLVTEVAPQPDLPSLLLRLRHGEFDGALVEWTGRDTDDLGSLFRSRGAQNHGGFAAHEVDQVIEALRRPEQADGPRSDERVALRERLAALLEVAQPALFLYAPDVVYLYGRRLRPARLVDGFFLLRDVGPR